MANARRILSSADIIISRGKGERLSVIVSAVAGISNSLQAAIDACTARTINSDYVHDIKKIHEEICFELQSKLSGFQAEKVLSSIQPNFASCRLFVVWGMPQHGLLPHNGNGRALFRSYNGSGSAC